MLDEFPTPKHTNTRTHTTPTFIIFGRETDPNDKQIKGLGAPKDARCGGNGRKMNGKSHSHRVQAKVKRSNFSCTNPKNQNQRLDSACTVRARAPMMVDLNYESSPYIRRHSVLPRRGDNLTKIHSSFLYFSSPKIVVPLDGVNFDIFDLI